MLGQNDIDKIKDSLEGYLGRDMRIVSKKGRKKKIVRKGVLVGVYPSVFTVKLYNLSKFTNQPNRTVSFNYTDILTRAIEVSIYTENANDK